MSQLIPPALQDHWQATRDLLHGVEGYLSDAEAEWLYLTAATCPAEGAVVEIGSFTGKSTIALARGIEARGGGEKLVAIDPHCAPASTDPPSRGQGSSEPELRANLARAGIADIVDVRVQYSQDAAKGWNAPIRLLWLDGDHTFQGVQADFDCWTPHLSEGGVLAMHDVLHRFEGPAQVFLKCILLSPGWSGVGFVRKSIGYAAKAGNTDLTQTPRRRLQAALVRRMVGLSTAQGRLARMQYNLCRTLVRRT